MTIVHSLEFDMLTVGAPPVVNVTQLDSNTRVIEAVLWQGAEAFNPDADAEASFACVKPDRTKCWYDQMPDGSGAASIAGNTVSVKLAPEVMTVSGTVNASIVIRSGAGDQISVFPFVIRVLPNPAAGSTISNDYYKVHSLDKLNETLTLLEYQLEGTVRFSKQTLTTAQKTQARANIGAAGETVATDAKYFDIDFDGIVSLKAEYQANGSKNAELPEIIVIPDVIDGTAVSALSANMFAQNTRVKSITIPSYILAIPEMFAYQAINLTEINSTENVESIGKAAFAICSIKKAIFPNLKQFNGASPFNCTPYLAVVDIGNTVTSLPKYCFFACESLSLVLGGASVTSIGIGAFYGTRNLKNLPIVANATSIGEQAFVLSRVNFDWWNHTFSSVGANGTPAKFNPTDWWSGCTYEACENPLGSTFHQRNPEWAGVLIPNSSDTYDYGCVEISTAHIYSALTGVTFDSPRYFVENIVGGIDNGSLLTPTGDEGGEPAYNYEDMANWLTHLGLECEVLADGYNSTNLQKVYDALKEGALILTGINPGHAGVLYGIASNGEVLVLDSDSYQMNIGVYEARTFQQPIWSIAKADQGIVIVKKGE